MIDARSSLSNDWQQVLAFDLQLGNLIHPTRYVVYTNWRDHPSGLCCVGRAGAMVERSPAGESDGERQLIERNSNSVVDWCVGGYVVVAASGVLDEGVAGSEDPC